MTAVKIIQTIWGSEILKAIFTYAIFGVIFIAYEFLHRRKARKEQK